MKIAVLDLHNGREDEGIRSLHLLIENFSQRKGNVTFKSFDVRKKLEIADLSYDVYISTGGPGSPLESEGSSWEKNYFGLMNNILQHNRRNPNKPKYVFLICHSFQIFCRYYGYAKVTKRKSASFGIMPVHKTQSGFQEALLKNLSDLFYAADSRSFQVLQPDKAKLAAEGGYVACIEKERPLIKLERSAMAIRFNHAIFGIQFLAEMDTKGMELYLHHDDNMKYIFEKYGHRKYDLMIEHLAHGRLDATYQAIIPNFLEIAFERTQASVNG